MLKREKALFYFVQKNEMNKSSLIVFISLASLPAFAQISGSVEDDQRQGVPFANVIL
jgi:hypothetical protein